jgi:hypothetical protein
MAKRTPEPTPGRSTTDAALIALKNKIAQRYEQADREARKLHAEREREQVRPRQREDMR